MATNEKELLSKMQNAYAALYDDLNEAATDDYNEYLWNTYGHVTDHNWADKDTASGALRYLIEEAYESFLNPEVALENAGVDEEMRKILNI